MFLTCNHFAVIYKNKAESLFTSLPPFIIIEDLRIYRVFFTHSFQRTEADYKNVLRYLEFLRTVYGNDANFICGYEAGCLGYTLYHQLTEHHVNCVILAPTTMLEQRSKKRIKTDKRDAEIIAKCLAQHNYSPVHIPTAADEETKGKRLILG